jgi:hydroxymethylpyrimidine/phosphomethylpyrimidine kinase
MTPCVLVFAGLDPGGGAGLAADILAIAAQGAHALPVATALTCQDNNRVFEAHPVNAGLVARQAAPLVAAFDIRAVKLGIPGNAANAAAIATCAHGNPSCRWCSTRCWPAAMGMHWGRAVPWLPCPIC